ncbi:MAG: cytochrome c [Rubrivivax sp.]|nr:cytochrome c [Rubrivivax sp.]
MPTLVFAQGPTQDGAVIYAGQCLACHGADGAGTMPGVPDFMDPSGVLRKSDDVLLRSVIDGVQRPGAAATMPALGGNPALTPADMRAVLNLLRCEFALPNARPTGEK